MHDHEITVSFGQKLQQAVFLERPNRFLLRCRLPASGTAGTVADSGEVVEAHLADPGRLRELLVPGRPVWLRPAEGKGPLKAGKRKTKWSAVLCCNPEGTGLVCLDATLPNRLVHRALQAGALPEFAGFSLRRPEFALEGSRFDFLLENAGGRQLLLEVKSVTLVEGETALFPDALTARGAKHVRELGRLVQSGAYAAAVLFVVQRREATAVHAAASIDPVFAAALAEAREAGVAVYGRRCYVNLLGVTLGEPLPAG